MGPRRLVGRSPRAEALKARIFAGVGSRAARNTAVRFELVTIFPEIEAALGIGILGKARSEGQIAIDLENPRDHTRDRHRSVDDYPYGGGDGMVLMAPPVLRALAALDSRREGPTRTILLSPQGQPFDQRAAERLAGEPAITLICGRYEGFDERIRDRVDEEISLGDFVLLGGEVAALAVVEAVARLLPGVLGSEGSAVEESHTTGLLEYPQYTRPAELPEELVGEGSRGIPPVLISGHHAKIARWRRKEALRRTLERRPDLLDRARDEGQLGELDMELLAELAQEIAAEELGR